MSEEVNEKTLLAREELAGHYKSIINLLGEDVDREGLLLNARTCSQSHAVPDQRIS